MPINLITAYFPANTAICRRDIMAAELEALKKFILENKGKRKFKQTVELAINFKGIDFSKQDNRVNIEVSLPNGKGKSMKVGIFATDKNIIEQAKSAGAVVIDGSEIDSMSKDPARMNSLLDLNLIAQPNLMPQVARSMGQFLGPRNKMPKPMTGNMNIASITGEMDKNISIRNRGKNLPTVHCVIGTEDMDPEKIYANANEVISSVSKKVGGNHIKSAYVKLTMSPPFKIT